MKNLKTAAPAPAPAPPSSGTKKKQKTLSEEEEEEGILKKKRKKKNGEKKEPSDFDLFVLVYAFLQTNDYGEAAEKMMREMKRRLRKEMNSMGGENDENDDFDENTKKKKNNNNNNKTKMVMRKKKLVQMLNGLGKGAKNATTTTVTSTSEQQSSPSPLVRLLPRVKPLRAIMSEFLTMKAKERRRKKSTNEPMKMIFRQCEEAFGNLRKEEVDDDEEEDEDDDDDGREGVVDILAVGEGAKGNGRKRRREDEDIDAAEALALAAAGANPLEEEEEENNNNNNNNNNDDDATATHTNNTNATGERRNKKKQAAPQRKHKQTIYKQSLDDANVREKIADVIVRTLHKKTGRTPNPTPTMTNSAKRNKNVEREELAFSDVEEDEEDDEFGHHRVTELELDKIAELMEKPEDTMETANAILGSLMESTDNDLGRFLEDLVAQTEHGNTKEINKLPTPKKRLLLKEDQKAANLKETNNGQKTP